VRTVACFGLLAVAVGYAVATHGGDSPFESSISLVLLAVAALVAGNATDPKAPRDRIVDSAALLFPAYVAFQLVPLPVGLLRIVSPTRSEIVDALRGVMVAPQVAPLSIAPPSTWMNLARVAGYALIFLVVRQLTRRAATRAWMSAIPLLVIGTLEAAWAFTAPQGTANTLSGTYYNKNHLAGLLELILPFAATCGFIVLDRGKERDSLTTLAAFEAVTLFGAATAMFVAILFSTSKLGLFSTLGSLAVMGIVAVRWRSSGWRMWTIFAGLAVLGLMAVVFLTPAEFVEQFGALVSDSTREGRLPISKDTLHLIAAYPLFGSGLGTFYPGLLRYQTSGLNVVWINAHNDYLQLLAELGVVGFLIPAALMGTLFLRAARTARSARNRETRLLGLACVGALAAILIHSVGDYNTYVLANAMVLAWIAGISASLPLEYNRHALVEGEAVTARRNSHYWFGLAAAGVVGLYASSWLLFLNHFRDSPSAERVFCHFGICDTDAAMAALQNARDANAGGALTVPQLLEYLPRDGAAPARWSDVGVALQKAGRTAEARYSFERANALAPNSPPTLLMAADFHFDVGEHQQALRLMARSLRNDDQFDNAVFGDLENRRISAGEILESGLLDRRSSAVYFRGLIENNHMVDAEEAWHWIVQHGYADDRAARDYVEFLIGGKQVEAAFGAWTAYARGRDPGYPERDRIFNGGFESDATGCRFDWKVEPAKGTAIDFDRGLAYSGARSLRVQFDGTANPGELGVGQVLFLTPGRYRLRGYIRTKELSTDEGVSLRVANVVGTAPLDAVTEKLRGTTDWTKVECVFDAPAGGGLVRVSLTRKPSLKFDNLVRGTAWIDQLSISPEGPSMKAPR
jgi:O-antigen ligase